jgi:hypothetical protein
VSPQSTRWLTLTDLQPCPNSRRGSWCTSLRGFDELVAWPGRGTHIALGRVIHEIKSGWAPPSLHVDLFRAQGCEPAIYTMADIDRFAALSKFKAWLVAHELAIPKEL